MQAISDIFTSLGGISAVAASLNEKADTVYRWQVRERIPENAIIRIAMLAEKHGVEVTATDLLQINAPMLKRGWPLGKPRKPKRRRVRQ